MKAGRLFAAVAVSAALAAAPPAGAQPGEAEAVHGEFVVSFEPGTSAKERRRAVERHGGRIVASIDRLGAYAVEFEDVKRRRDRSADRDKERELEDDSAFELVEPNFLYRALLTPNDPSLSSQYAWGRIGAYTAWDTTRGSSATRIAVVDTGVQSTHPDLDAKLVPGYDYVSGDSSPEDGNGHGTHVAGTAAAETGNATGGAGTCPDCSIMALRVLGDNGSGSLSDVAKGITWAVDNGARVVNLSLGGPSSSTLQQAVDYAASKGAFLACSAGNDGTTSTSSAYPAAYPNCFAVASTTSSDARSSFSNHGAWVEVAAPGSSIYSTYKGSAYATMSGTSMAAPHVAGLAGLLASQGLTGAAIRDRICATADPIPGTGSSWTCGRINAAAAVGPAGPQPTPTPDPTPTPTADAIANGGFESGSAPWTLSSTGGYSLISTEKPHTGSHSAWLGGYTGGTDAVSQAITVPAGGSLTYWWHMTTAETASKTTDRLRVRVLSSSGSVLATLRTWSNRSAAGAWGQDTLSLASWAGQQVRVEFQATNSSSRATSFFVDDVSVR